MGVGVGPRGNKVVGLSSDNKKILYCGFLTGGGRSLRGWDMRYPLYLATYNFFLSNIFLYLF